MHESTGRHKQAKSKNFFQLCWKVKGKRIAKTLRNFVKFDSVKNFYLIAKYSYFKDNFV